MPISRPYAISASPERLTLHKDSRTGEVSFTVTNQTEQTIRTEVRLRSLDDALPDWFSLRPVDRIREIAPGKSSQCTVEIKVPPDVEAGSYRFRLDANSVNHPEEIYTEGPVVPVEVKPAEVPEEGFKFRWWMAVAAAVLLLLVAGGLIWALGGDSEPEPEVVESREVPNVVGIPVDVAAERLEREGFDVQREGPVPNLNADANNVISQEPAALEAVDPGTTVTLTFAGETVEVPNVRGKSLLEGLEQLRERGLEYGGAFGDRDRADEPLEGSNPGEGTAVLEGTAVSLLLPGRRVFIPVEQLQIQHRVLEVNPILQGRERRILDLQTERTRPSN